MSGTFLVLGSNSFSGAHFVDHALAQGHTVIGVSRSPEPHPVFLPYKRRNSDRFRFYQCDMLHQPDRLTAIIEKNKPAFVVNFAAQGMVAESWGNPAQWFDTNLMAAIRLHDVLRGQDRLEKFVQISTPEVYGSCAGLVDENACLSPSTPYAVSKAACDMSLRTYHQQYGFPVVTTRAANVYGPCQQLYRIVPRAVLCIKEGRKLTLDGGGAAERSFIHIRDACAATLALAICGAPGETYHLSTDRIVSIRELIRLICGLMKVDFDEVTEVGAARPGADTAYKLDSTKVRQAIQWKDEIPLEDGLADTIRWVRDNHDVLTTQAHEYVHKP